MMKCEKVFLNKILFILSIGGLLAANNGLASVQQQQEGKVDFPPQMTVRNIDNGGLIDHSNIVAEERNQISSKTIFDFSDINSSSNQMNLEVAEFEQNDAGNRENTDLSAQPEPEKESANGGYTDAQIAEMINNPLGELWLFFTQNDTYSYGGDALDAINKDNRIMNSTLLMPVLPMQLTDNWKLIVRPVIPINSFDVPKSVDVRFEQGFPEIENINFNRETGLGDIVLWTALATNEMARPPNVFGFGTTMMFDTATEDALGTGKNSIGPMAMAMHIDDKWIYGLITQHWWSVSGDSDRNDVSLTDIQYVGRYRLRPETNIGFSPNIRYNWEAKGGNRWSIPVGLGMDTMIKLGPVPAKIALEFYHYVKQPDPFGPEWQVRFIISPVLPAPKWTKKAIF